MKLTAWDILHQDGGEYAEDIDRRHKLIEDAIDKGQTILRFYDTAVEPARGFVLYEKLYELEKAGQMPTFEADYDKYGQKTLFKIAGLKPVSYDILDLQNRRDLLSAYIFAYNQTDSYDNMQEALDKYEDSLDAGRWAVLSYAIMDGQKIHPEVLPDNEDTLTLENLEYFMEWATDHYIEGVVCEVAYNMRGDINIRFDHNGLIDMENSKADPEILEDVRRNVVGYVQKEPGKEPEMTHLKEQVIGKLSDFLKDYEVSSNLIVNNYDGKTAGNHHVGNFVEALEENNYDFDVVRLEISGKDTKWETPVIIVQTDDYAAFNTFGYTANKKAIEHDKIMGDGKYCEKEEPEEERE